MQKSLPKKVETQIVVEFLSDSFTAFEKKIEGKFDTKFGELSEEMNEKFSELKEMVGTSGLLIKNTHQEIKHFMQLHETLDKRLVKLEGEVSELRELEKRVTALEEKLAH